MSAVLEAAIFPVVIVILAVTFGSSLPAGISRARKTPYQGTAG